MFVVLHRWRLREERITDFERGWSEVIRQNIEKYGALGSRLHKSKDGFWVSYAQWPTREHWHNSLEGPQPLEARALMVSAILEQYPPIEMTPVLDHLISTHINLMDG